MQLSPSEVWPPRATAHMSDWIYTVMLSYATFLGRTAPSGFSLCTRPRTRPLLHYNGELVDPRHACPCVPSFPLSTKTNPQQSPQSFQDPDEFYILVKALLRCQQILRCYHTTLISLL